MLHARAFNDVQVEWAMAYNRSLKKVGAEGVGAVKVKPYLPLYKGVEGSR